MNGVENFSEMYALEVAVLDVENVRQFVLNEGVSYV